MLQTLRMRPRSLSAFGLSIVLMVFLVNRKLRTWEGIIERIRADVVAISKASNA